ncbi:DsbA family protein [Chitinophaga sedimenti]|uniref:ClpXP adapter SpxH family protein n=1 Tax=Chitinophaga sedimenti TaxID=2033606 RepID=UPI0020051BC4|nr:ClpXP adapter SpxH family protein [Chitinophaga sedimenti]MCK7554741.1 DsbA family protein [Chitinophaga sedimenti]
MEQDSAKVNPLLCDPETGICEIPTTGESAAVQRVVSNNKPVQIVYFTDPICSSCWGIEPQLRRLKLEYGGDVEINYHMGGLLPDWSYNSGGISKPSDVAHHWDEVSQYYKMPIDGDVWLSDPLPSSYPPSIAFKAAQLQDKSKAIGFLRVLREMVFLQKKNITKWEHMEQAGLRAGLDTKQLKADYEGRAKDLFNEDLALGRKLGVRGFPTIFISNAAGESEMVYGFKPYTNFEAAIKKVYAGAAKTEYAKDWKNLFNTYPTLTLREFAELSETSFTQAEQLLTNLVNEQHTEMTSTKNGAIWSKR